MMDLQKIRKAWRGLIFRRVHLVVPNGNPISILRKENDVEFKEITFQEYNNLPSEIKERECEVKYESFSGFTTSQPMLKKELCCKSCCNDYEHTISFHSSNFCELDMSSDTASFYFDTNIPICKLVDTIPRPYRKISKVVRYKVPTGTAENIEMGKRLVEKGMMLKNEAMALKNKSTATSLHDAKIMEKLMVVDDNKTIVNIKDEENIVDFSKRVEELLEEASQSIRQGLFLLNKQWTSSERTLELAGDIICGVLNPMNKDRFQFWFIASEQFYRFFQIIMHDNKHPGTIKAKLNTRERVLLGNSKLCTNTFKKKMYEIAKLKEEIEKKKEIQSSSVSWADIMELDDVLEKLTEKLELLEIPEFWCLRSEKLSRNFFHIYPALIMKFVYNEKLTSENIPGKVPEWVVPGWLL